MVQGDGAAGKARGRRQQRGVKGMVQEASDQRVYRACSRLLAQRQNAA